MGSVTPPSAIRSRKLDAGGWAIVVIGVVGGALAAGQWWRAVHAPPRDDFPRQAELREVTDLIFGLDATVEDYAKAESLVARALTAKPDDPETEIVAAEVNNWYFFRGFDRSEARYESMQRHSARALQLAPDQPEALASMGEFLQAREADLPRAVDLLQRAIATQPRVPRWHSSLAEALRINDPDAGLRTLEAAAKRFPHDVLIRYNLARHYRDVGRLEDMERVLDEVIALQPIANALLWKARVLLWAHGDVTGMKRMLDRVPRPLLVSERAAINLFVYANLARQADDALRILRELPNDWFDDYDYVGPKGLLVGGLLELQGKADEARAEFQKAFADVQRRKPSDMVPDVSLRVSEIWSLLALGRMPEARAAYRIHLNNVSRPYQLRFSTSWWFSEIPAALLLGDRATALQLAGEAAQTPQGRTQLRVAFQIDPRLARWHDDPDFAALIAARPVADSAH